MLERALINTILGDAHFWKHPESRHHNIVWTSVHRSWLEWKQQNLLPEDVRLPIYVQRAAGSLGCFSNAKTLYAMKCRAVPEVDLGINWSVSEALQRADSLDLAIWYLDDGCCVSRKDTENSYRVTISVGSSTAEDIFPQAMRLLGTSDLGRVYKNNSRASEKNKSWIIPKTAAVQILAVARRIAPPEMQYKTPLW